MPGRLTPRRWLSLIFMLSVLLHDTPLFQKPFGTLFQKPVARMSLAALTAAPATPDVAAPADQPPEEEPLPDADAAIVPPEEPRFLAPEEVPAPEPPSGDGNGRSEAERPKSAPPLPRFVRGEAGEGGGVGGAMLWPARGYVSSRYGWRWREFHKGVDIAGTYGSEVRAAAVGVVTAAGWYGGYGRAVIIDHGGGVQTLYGHNARVLVSPGQRVEKGELIALMGCSGRCTGPHVHFEVRRGGQPVNPMRYLR